eukprot:TRINITY_DN547_c0_g1_i1.p1 TRINITY_DN547_c0_g1~~TRINITY_DN547_c0_g1_i1.p1  ORF type:complete len:416 (-),score=83.62 TRINITY_DN547_c0_g1_i1:11-1258(-)
MSFIGDVPHIEPDGILVLNSLYNADSNPLKVNLGVGAYRNDEGFPYILKCVDEAESRLKTKYDHEYPPIQGKEEYLTAAKKVIFGSNSHLVFDKRICAFQSISASGALTVIMDFIKQFVPEMHFFLSSPTWPNHIPMLKGRFMEEQIHSYRYYSESTKSLDFKGMIEDIENIPEGSVILLQPICHNPTGVDPDNEQWKLILQVILDRKIIPFIDCAYQGFCSGNLSKDSFMVKLFAETCLENQVICFICQSFSKNMGLYGERIGSGYIICASENQATACLSQIKHIARIRYSMPPIHGAQIVTEIMEDDDLWNLWNCELKEMSNRIMEMRHALKDNIMKLEIKNDINVNLSKWDFIINEFGMFSFTGLTPSQVNHLASKYSIYIVKSGRISIPGLNHNNIEYVAQAIFETTQNIM